MLGAGLVILINFSVDKLLTTFIIIWAGWSDLIIAGMLYHGFSPQNFIFSKIYCESDRCFQGKFDCELQFVLSVGFFIDAYFDFIMRSRRLEPRIKICQSECRQGRREREC